MTPNSSTVQNQTSSQPLTCFLPFQPHGRVGHPNASADWFRLCHRYEFLRKKAPVQEGRCRLVGLCELELIKWRFAGHPNGRLHVHRDAGGPPVVLPDGSVLRGRHHPRDAVWRVHAADEEVRPGLGHQAEAAEVRGGISWVEELFLNCCDRNSCRYLKKHVWTEVFQKLLNIKDINHMPKLSALKELIDGEVFNMESELMKHIRTLSNLLKRR